MVCHHVSILKHIFSKVVYFYIHVTVTVFSLLNWVWDFERQMRDTHISHALRCYFQKRIKSSLLSSWKQNV